MIRVAGLLDSGILIPDSAARIGAVLEPYTLEVGTAAQGGSLEVVGKSLSSALLYPLTWC